MGGDMIGLALRAAIFDDGIYKDIRDRQETAFSALGIVFIAGVAFGLGVWGQVQVSSDQGFRLDQSFNLALAISCAFSSWVIWAVFVWMLAGRLFGGAAGYRVSLRSLGVCYLPITLWAFIGIPTFGTILFMLGAVWTLAAAVGAVRSVHEIEWWKAGVAAGIGWFWAVILQTIVLVILPLMVEPV